MTDASADRSSGAWAAVVAFAVIVAAVGGFLWWRSRQAPDYVFVVGDSVTFLSGAAIEDAFSDSDVGFIARPGYRSIDLRPLLEEAMAPGGAAKGKELGIFVVGYNDVRRETLDSKSLPPMVEDSAEWECAIWFTLPTNVGGEPVPDPAWAPDKFELWNQRLSDEVAKYDNLHLAREWQQFVEGADNPDELFDPDRIHPTEMGAEELATAMKEAADNLC